MSDISDELRENLALSLAGAFNELGPCPSDIGDEIRHILLHGTRFQFLFLGLTLEESLTRGWSHVRERLFDLHGLEEK
jgi:hypothetical protein